MCADSFCGAFVAVGVIGRVVFRIQYTSTEIGTPGCVFHPNPGGSYGEVSYVNISGSTLQHPVCTIRWWFRRTNRRQGEDLPLREARSVIDEWGLDC